MQVPELPRWAGPVGVGLEAAGLALRAWSMLTLGHSYTRTLQTSTDQQVVDSGPYRKIRHPGYAASLMIWTGYGLASRSVPGTAIVTALLARAYRRRIAAEEELLTRDLPGYTDYRARTRRIIPFVW